MLYNYLLNKYNNGDPIFLSEIPGKSKSYIRLAVKKLVDKGVLRDFIMEFTFCPIKQFWELGVRFRLRSS